MASEVPPAPALTVRQAAYLWTIPLVMGPLILICGMFEVFAPKIIGTGLLLVFFGAGLIWMATRLMRRLPVLMEVSERGIMIYASASYAVRSELFIPWERLELMRFLGKKELSQEHLWFAVRNGFGPVLPGCIGLRLRMDAFWPGLGALRRDNKTRRARPDEIFLLSGECSPGGKELWREMAALAKRYAGPRAVADETEVARRN